MTLMHNDQLSRVLRFYTLKPYTYVDVHVRSYKKTQRKLLLGIRCFRFQCLLFH